MSDFTDIYKEYVILQYYNQPNAQAEIQLYSDEHENIYDFYNDFYTQFDLDQATGDRLDLIGKIVGLSRIIEGGIVKEYFGFGGATGALAYGQGRWRSESDTLTSPSELDDGQYRLFLKAKVIKNNSNAKMITDDREGYNTQISRLFDKRAYAVDNLDMTITLNIDDDYPSGDVTLLQNSDLLPRPQGVSLIINYIPVVP